MHNIEFGLYSYDPLDRLVGTSHVTGDKSQRFYCKKQLTTEIQGQFKQSIFQNVDQPLAQQQCTGLAMEISLLATDQQQSILNTLAIQHAPATAYTPYGHRFIDNGLPNLLGFNGERQDSLTGNYLLGNGYRTFNPELMRFNNPDNLSPFGRGGLNSYSYCGGNPISRKDPTGKYWQSVASVLKKPLKRLYRSAQTPGFKPRISTAKSTTPHSLKTPDFREPILLKNTREKFFSSEYKAFNKATMTDPFEVVSVTNAEDLKHLGGSLPRRFVLTRNGELLIDPSIDLERRNINHAILASFGGSSSEVLSAGTISANTRQATIWNDSGHYRPDFSALTPVASFLKSLGVEVSSIRVR